MRFITEKGKNHRSIILPMDGETRPSIESASISFVQSTRVLQVLPSRCKVEVVIILLIEKLKLYRSNTDGDFQTGFLEFHNMECFREKFSVRRGQLVSVSF